MSKRDIKAVARERFAEAEAANTDIIGQRATDVPLVVRGLLEAIDERAPAGARVIELGFGSGWLLEELASQARDRQLAALDMSPGFARAAHGRYGDRVRVLLGDMERLPFRDGALDVAVTCWTLYFMRDIDATLEEIKRCLAPGGRLVAATSAREHEAEANQLVADAVRHALGRNVSDEELDVGRRFDLESGEALARRHFANVEIRRWQGQMVLSVAEVASMWKKWEPALLSKIEQDTARAAFLRLLQERFGSDGSLTIRRREGAFVCDL
ncbi:MAG: class I SAM-dependent methyltransferase [Dehalococcoidia bacterium]